MSKSNTRKGEEAVVLDLSVPGAISILRIRIVLENNLAAAGASFRLSPARASIGITIICCANHGDER